MSQATMMASLLWLVVTHPSTVQAFALTSGRHPSLHKQSQQQNFISTPNVSARYTCTSSLFVSALADLELRSSPLNGLFAMEGCPEDALHLPHWFLPNKIPEDEEVLEWAERYTTVEALRAHFGTNQNKLWGDLQASTARRLYKTLLPRALLELSKLGKIDPQDLAPLAYRARVAAKLYARERCTVPARIAATLFDGFRQWIKYGTFQAQGMTYDQLWEKYAGKILKETEAEHLRPGSLTSPCHPHHDDDDEDEECDPFHADCEDLSEQVCRKILERACVSNEGVDALALRGQDLADETTLEPHQRHLLRRIRRQLEEDMYELLLPPGVDRPHPNEEQDKFAEAMHSRNRTLDLLQQGKFRLVKQIVKQRRLWKLQKAQLELALRLSRPRKSCGDRDTVTKMVDPKVEAGSGEEKREWNP